ncbi:MAG: ATP-binding cassette domain-containing protein [Desulfobacteraceae bacterium]|nr:ATP-binding cassette domain-containing protein [Desulfobacteraceae bacterium]
MNPEIVCENVDFSRHRSGKPVNTVLTDINVRFKSGTLAMITGETGSGKSTFLSILAGLRRPTGGRVFAGGKPVSQWISRHKDLWRRRVGIVFQDLNLMDHLSVMENIMLPMICRRMELPEIRRRSRLVMGELDLDELAGERTGTISGGQRQRTALARALIGEPDYLFADEPSAFQDDKSVSRILTLLAGRADKGAVVVVCSHDQRLRDARLFTANYRLAIGRLTMMPPMAGDAGHRPGDKS